MDDNRSFHLSKGARSMLVGSSFRQGMRGLGLIYRTKSDQVGLPIHDLEGDPEWTNPNADGVLIRSAWDRMEPHEHANANDFYWGFFDQAVQLGAEFGKPLAFLVTAGVTTPQWVYDAGAYKFDVSTAVMHISAASNGLNLPRPTINLDHVGSAQPSSGTVYVETTNGFQTVTYTGKTTTTLTGCAGGTGTMFTGNDVLFKEPMSLPWDTVFLAKWEAFLDVFLARYGDIGALYLCTGGFGRRAESILATYTPDQDALDAQAQLHNFTDGLDGWLTAAKLIVDMHADRMPNTQMMCVMGSPYDTNAGADALVELLDYGLANYAGRFGFRSDGLWINQPGPGENGYIQIREHTNDPTLVGYQFYLNVTPGDTSTLQQILDYGIGNGAHFIEVPDSNMDDPSFQSILASASLEMRSTYF